ncbi:MAG: histidine phosphatase family protein [Candidatus Bathyarchaeota archaeon]|nr:MAG: histidine phosphatase family protein [Candidatus Bathyarchaeota archaeon]
MKRLILIRHGEAEHMTGDYTGGWTDLPLTELGRRQARAVAKRLGRELEGVRFELLCSDLIRARETADIIGEELGVAPRAQPELRELNNGVASGKTKEEASAHFSEPTKPYIDWQPYPGAETWRRFHARVAGYMESLSETGDKTLVIVAHGGTIINIINWWLELDMETVNRVSFSVTPASITVLGTTVFHERSIERLNDVSHLLDGGLLEDRLLKA